MTREQVLDKYAKAREDVLRAVSEIPRKFTLLDCFCGMGGVSDGFALEGFDVTGIDIVDAPKMLGYKHRFIQADMMTLHGEDFRGYDVIWYSPPCIDFSIQSQVNKGYADRQPPNPERGLKIIEAVYRFTKNAQPKIWLMENVSRLEKFWNDKPILRFYTSRNGRRTLWGNLRFPIMFDIRPQRNMEYDYVKLSYRLRSAARAKIPLACSCAFAKACEEKLLETQTI